MTNIAILAAGPPKANRNRHLETTGDTIIIDHVINNCRVPDTKLYVVINSENTDLINHIKNYNDITILHPKDEKILSTFETALSPKGDTVLVCGDLVNLKKGDVDKFVNSKYRSATCLYNQPWGNHITSTIPSLLRRGDCGDCISKIAQEHKEEYLGDDMKSKCHWFFKQFTPDRALNENIYNDVGTFTSFAFFNEIWSNPECNEFEDKGVVRFDHQIYLDND